MDACPFVHYKYTLKFSEVCDAMERMNIIEENKSESEVTSLGTYSCKHRVPLARLGSLISSIKMIKILLILTYFIIFGNYVILISKLNGIQNSLYWTMSDSPKDIL